MMHIITTTFLMLFLLRLKAASADESLQLCRNTPDWKLDVGPSEDSSDQYVDCNAKIVSCQDTGSLGPATGHCCKCKAECRGKCENLDKASSAGKIASIGFGIATLFTIGLVAYHCCYFRVELRETRRIMLERRQQERENSHKDGSKQAMNEEDLQVIFFFHEVDADVVDLEQTQSSETNTAEVSVGCCPSVVKNNTPSCTCTNNKETQVINQLPMMSLLLRKECCICLEKYSPGEMVCISKTGSCKHVFHKECISEWINRENRCPLCRTKLVA